MRLQSYSLEQESKFGNVVLMPVRKHHHPFPEFGVAIEYKTQLVAEFIYEPEVDSCRLYPGLVWHEA